MDDYIKREDALDIVADNNVTGEITINRYDKIIDGIYDIPSADVAPIVRCEDCKHRYITGSTTHYYVCDFMDAEYNDNGYCHHGERKGDEID